MQDSIKKFNEAMQCVAPIIRTQLLKIPDAMKNDKVISLLINFIKKQTEFIGTASELASTLGGETKANVLTRRLSRYKNELADMGITFEKSRSGERRELKINYKPDDDMTVMTDS